MDLQPKYIPKASHPWRRYKNRFIANGEEEKIQNLPDLKNFLYNLVNNWETYQIESNDFEGVYNKVKNISQVRVAEWLVGILKRTWVSPKEGYANYV